MNASVRTDERGSAAVELVIIIPGVIMLLGLLLAGGRIWYARGLADDAAYAAARSASIARTASQASADGEVDGLATLSSVGLECRDPQVRIDTSAFATPVGVPAAVSADVLCTVDLADLIVPGLPGSVRLTASASAPLDTYRAR